MELYSNFKLEDTYRKLSECRLVDPTMISVGGKYLDLSPTVSQTLNKKLGLKSKSFSSSLFKLDPELWSLRYEKASKFVETLDFVKNSAVMISSSTVISVLNISQSDYFRKFIETLDKINEDEDLQLYYRYDYDDAEKEFVVVINSISKGFGYLVNYDISKMQLKSYPIVQTEFGGYVGYNSICDVSLESDDFMTLLDPQVSLSLSELAIDEAVEFYNKANKTLMSVGELAKQLKHDFAITLSSANKVNVELAVASEFQKFLEDVLDRFYNSDSYKYVASPRLTRAIVSTPITYGEYYRYVISQFLACNFPLSTVISLSEYISKDKTDYNSVSLSKKLEG